MEKFEWCLGKGKAGEKHKGVREIHPDRKEADEHINKALHNLDAMDELHRLGRFSDWVLSTAFYAMYHAALAVLYELGYESRNQECTFTMLEHFIDKKMINVEKEFVWIARGIGEIAAEKDAKTLREEFQYGVKTKAEAKIVGAKMKDARKFVQRMRVVIEELRSI
ncbi:HEPN domain protein [uncultured archaeon]|nr:HEPN domain protein [uncultured archaeon]